MASFAGDQGVEGWRNRAALELSSFVEIAAWILSWGRHAQVIAPKELIQETAKEMAELRGICWNLNRR